MYDEIIRRMYTDSDILSFHWCPIVFIKTTINKLLRLLTVKTFITSLYVFSLEDWDNTTCLRTTKRCGTITYPSNPCLSHSLKYLSRPVLVVVRHGTHNLLDTNLSRVKLKVTYLMGKTHRHKMKHFIPTMETTNNISDLLYCVLLCRLCTGTE